MNEIIKAIKERRSIRSFRPDDVPEELISQVIEAGTYAANGRGFQSTVIVEVTNPKLRNELMEENRRIGGWSEGFDPFYGSPVILIVLADKSRPTYLYDGSLVMGELMLAAHSLGLGSCWIHRAKEEFESEWGKELLKTLGLPDCYEGIGHCAIGYINGNAPSPAPRKNGRVFRIP